MVKLRTQINKLFDKKDQLDIQIKQLQETCPHKVSVYQAKGSGGGWDRDPSYWYDFYCYDCRKHWTTEQEYKIYGSSLKVDEIDIEENPEKIELLFKMRDLK